VTIRHAALALGAVLVLGLGVYLFIEVRATPAAAQAQPTARQATPPPPAIDEETDPAPPALPEPKQIPRASPRLAAMEPGTREAPRAEPRLGAFVRPEDRAAASFPDPKLVAVMDEASKAYDRGDIDDAKAVAQKVLAKAPENPRMLRIVVSASCIAGDSAEAEKSYRLLPGPDREQMKIRCARYGVTFKDD
jgi:hypothetical protein